MNGGPGDHPADEDPASLAYHLKASTRNLLAYLQTRVQLFALESQEAYASISGRSVFWIIGGTSILVGYLLALTASVPLLADRFGQPWYGVCFLLATVHLVAGGILFYLAHRKFSAVYYEATLSELEKDRQWLARNSPNTPPKKPN